MKRLKSREWVLLIVIMGLVGFGMGYSIGYMSALNWSVDKAIWLLEIKGIEVDINAGLIAEGLWRYKDRIGEMNNASILLD